MNAKLNYQSELESLMRPIRRAVQYDRFALILANCSSFNDQKRYMEELQGCCSQINITLTTVDLWGRTPINNLYSIIRSHLDQSFSDKLPSSLAIQVTGLEVSILLDADERFPAVLQTLNISRERFRAELPYPLLIWLPDYAHIKLANVAPDFWSVRDGSFTFPADEQADPIGDLDQMVLEKKDITEWRDKTAQIPLIERILDSPIRLSLSDETKTDLLLKLGEAYRFVGKTPKAKENFEKALRLSREQLGNLEREGTALNGLGLVYTDWGEFASAIKHFEQYLTLKQGKDEAQAVGYNHLGFAQYKHGEHHQAIQSFENALAITFSLGKRKVEGDVLGNLGLVYRELGEFDQAIEYHQQALEISREKSQQQSEVKDLGNIGLVYHARRNYESAIEYYTYALDLSKQVGNRQDELNQLLNLGDVWRDRREFEQARKYYETAHRIAEEIGRTRLNLLTLERLVDLYGSKALKDPEREVYWTEKFIKQSKTPENLDNQRYCIKKLLKLCHSLDLSLSQKNEWLLKAEALVKDTFAPNSCVYLEKLIEIYKGLNQDDRVKSLQQKLAQVRRARQLTIWLAPGSVEVLDDHPTLNVRESYTFKIQIGGLITEYAWRYCRNLPEETSHIKFEDKPREGFKISTESTETPDEEPPKLPDITSTAIPASSPLPSDDSAGTMWVTPDPGSRTPSERQKEDNTAKPHHPEERNKIEPTPSVSLEFRGINLDLSPTQATLPLLPIQSGASVSLTVRPETCGDHRILVTVSVPDLKIGDEFEIPLRVVDLSAVEPPINPNDAKAYFNRGIARRKLGEYRVAIEDYTQAIRINPNYAKAYNNRGIARRKLGEYQAAIEDYTQAIRINPNYAKAYNNRGIARRKLGEYQAAIEDYTQAIRINPNDAKAYYNRGLTRYDLGEYQAAIEDYNEAMSINPHYGRAMTNIGLVRYEMGDVEEAIEKWRNAIAIDNKQAEPQLALAVALYTQGQREKSLKLGKEALTLDSSYADLKILKKKLWGSRLLADAQRFLRESV
ncbi:MAG: tetratricopeptide repeat protein [Xenococcaceae cyanobacterium]